jgi:hypothetical protein
MSRTPPNQRRVKQATAAKKMLSPAKKLKKLKAAATLKSMKG